MARQLRGAPEREGMSTDRVWWQEPFRTFQTNLREVDAALDVDAELDALQKYGANVWLLSVGGIIANYPSELDVQTVNPALASRDSGDLVGDAVAAATSRGVRVLGRMDFSKVDLRRAEAHPEWLFLDATGAPQIYNGYASVCPSAPYYQQAMFDVIAEVLGRYDLSGFFFNWMSFNERDYSRRYWGVCHCESCQAGFRAHSPGVALPSGPESEGYRDWQDYSNGVLADLTARMRAHLRALKPEACLILGDSADITFHEANNAVGRPLWHHATAEAVSAARSIHRDRVVLVNSVGFVDMPYRFAGEDPNHFAQYLLQSIAHGANPSTYVMGRRADSPYEALEIGGEITRFHRDNEDLYAGAQSAARVALVRGSQTARFPYEPGLQDRIRLAEFRGLYLGLVERHIPFDVVRADQLGELDPTRYALLVLPDLGPLDPIQVEALDAAIAAGAAVVATGDSAWHKGHVQLGGGQLPARLRASYLTEESVRSLHLPLHGTGGDLTPVVGPFHVLEAAEGVDTDWHAIGRAPYGPPEKCYGHESTNHPGWVSSQVGDGGLAYVPWRPGLVYFDIGLTRTRDAFIDKLLTFAPEPVAYGGDLPEHVQVVANTVEERLVLHLLNRSGDAPQRFIRPLPAEPGLLRLPARSDTPVVRARVAGTDLQVAVIDGVMEVQVPRIDRFEVLEVSWTGGTM